MNLDSIYVKILTLLFSIAVFILGLTIVVRAPAVMKLFGVAGSVTAVYLGIKIWKSINQHFKNKKNR